MKRLQSVWIAVISGLAFVAAPVEAYKPRPNFPYVQSMQEGVFYARCIPQETQGSKGTTKIYSVGKDKDKLVDSYDWYAKEGVMLAWSPTTGKVAVMALRGTLSATELDKQTVLSFYLGGKLLTSYTAQDLKEQGANIVVQQRVGSHLAIKAIGVEQQTGEYVFCVEVNGTKFYFDIHTGKQYIEG